MHRKAECRLPAVPALQQPRAATLDCQWIVGVGCAVAGSSLPLSVRPQLLPRARTGAAPCQARATTRCAAQYQAEKRPCPLLTTKPSPPPRGRLLPDPRYDAVRCIAMAVLEDAQDVPDGDFVTRCLLHCKDAAGPPADALHDVQARSHRRSLSHQIPLSWNDLLPDTRRPFVLVGGTRQRWLGIRGARTGGGV